MPKSKKRKKSPTRTPRAAPVTRTRLPAFDEDGNDTGIIRQRFRALAETQGHLFPAHKGYEPYGPVGECWTNAWNYAQATGLGFAEGVALMPDGWHAHAWCVTEDGAVIEPTTGYDRATEYRGWCLNQTDVGNVMVTGDGLPHHSFLESAIGSEVMTFDQIVDRFTYIPGTQF